MKLVQPEQQEVLKQTIDREARISGFSGAVEVTCQDQIIAAAAYGQANLAEERPNQRSTRFGMASGSKLFTAIAVCQLVEQGKLSFAGKVLGYLKGQEFPLFSPEFTIHQLLTHSSGIPDYFDEEVMEDFAALWEDKPMYTLRRPADFLPLFGTQPMMFTPGERFHYNNAGYILLGLLVEKASGMAFTEYVEQHIFRPCGMRDSGYFALGIHRQRAVFWSLSTKP